MHTTPRIDTARSRARIVHPAYCDPSRCVHRGYAVHHCSAPEVFIPRQRDTTEASMVQISIERLDEVDATGRQIVHADEVIFSDDCGVHARVGVEDLREMMAVAFGLYDADASCRLAG